jgi:hypothetical protein
MNSLTLHSSFSPKLPLAWFAAGRSFVMAVMKSAGAVDLKTRDREWRHA